MPEPDNIRQRIRSYNAAAVDEVPEVARALAWSRSVFPPAEAYRLRRAVEDLMGDPHAAAEHLVHLHAMGRTMASHQKYEAMRQARLAGNATTESERRQPNGDTSDE